MNNFYKNEARASETEESAQERARRETLDLRDKIAARVAKLEGVGDSIDEMALRREIRQLRAQLELPADRTCPVCRRVVFERRKWYKGKMCMSCYRTQTFEGPGEAREFLTPAYKYVVTFDSDLHQMDLAIQLGFSQSKVCRIQRGRRCSEEDMETIRDANDVDDFEIVERTLCGYHLDGGALRDSRLALGLGLRAFAIKCGWHNGKQNNLERTRGRILNLRDSKILLRVYQECARE